MKVSVFGPKLKMNEITTQKKINIVCLLPCSNSAWKLALAAASTTASSTKLCVSAVLRSNLLMQTMIATDPSIDALDTV
jgi:hypothetical protein